MQRWIMTENEHISNRLMEFVLGELPEHEKAEVSAHVAGCDACRAELRRLETVLDSAEQRRNLSVDDSVCKSARDRLMAMTIHAKSNPAALPEVRRSLHIRRWFMTSAVAKLGVAAVVAIVAALFGVSQVNRPDLLSKACAAEQSLFSGTKIVHIQNEIVISASPADSNEEWNDVWLPMCSVKTDGSLKFNQLKLPSQPESYVVTDHSWYDPATARFARILKTGGTVVFANAYDGQAVYTTAPKVGRGLQIVQETIAAGFKPPLSPAEYLGIAAGLKTSLADKTVMVQDVAASKLPDGKSAHVFKVGIPDPNAQLDTYWLFKVRDEDSTIAEKEFIMLGRSRLLIRRALTESVDAPAVAWNLEGLEGLASGASQVSVTPDMVIPSVSIEHMVNTAKFETYTFAIRPAWVGSIDITDTIDPASPGQRMFLMIARADDHRHLVFVQSPSYNAMLGPLVKQGTLVYTSPNGIKVWGGGRDKWLAGILLQSAAYIIKDPPAENRTGYVLESPTGTFPALAVNGPLTDVELHNLVDSLIPARQCLDTQKKASQKK
jgi:hypothetical protein